MPSNLLEAILQIVAGQGPPMNLGAGFDPQGSGYDYWGALMAGMGPDKTNHWSSRVPSSGKLLKGAAHPTWHKTLAGEKAAGYEIYTGSDGRYYSRKTK